MRLSEDSRAVGNSRVLLALKWYSALSSTVGMERAVSAEKDASLLGAEI